MAVLGVDGWRGQWVGALLEGRTVTLSVLPDAAAVLAVRHVEVVGIDMPIGLSDDGVRACDVAARNELRGRGAAGSVFPAPLRQVLICADYRTACEVSRAASGKALSVQSWNLVAAIRALDACAAAWSARRIAAGTAESLGDGSRDSRGRPMRICF